MTRVCVIVLNWNGWRDTVACVASLLQMDGDNFTVLIVDNNSSDDSVRHISQAFPTLKLLHAGSNLGFGGGCNVGIRYALQHGAEYVWLINSDATVDRGALSALVHVADHDQSVGAVGSVVFEAEDTARVQLWGGGRVNLWLGRSTHCLAAGAVDFVSGASMLLRGTALNEVG
ncbi:MAG: glycosyltransferase, partial [Rhodoferax sp.]